MMKRIVPENEHYQEMVINSLNPAKLLDLALKARMNQALETWLSEKSSRLGFAIVRDRQRGRMKFQAEGYEWHALPRKGKDAGFSSVDFQGELEVLDTQLLSKALFDGIGPSKAFGCGPGQTGAGRRGAAQGGAQDVRHAIQGRAAGEAERGPVTRHRRGAGSQDV
jgi:CRISPR system Cascade subunit CasE